MVDAPPVDVSNAAEQAAEVREPAPAAAENPFPEDLPPGFWDDDPAAAAERQGPALEAGFGRGDGGLEVGATGLEADPRFKVMQSLFPGRIVEWREADTGADESENTEEDAADTVNLEADES